ncbi:MAG TPA: threonine synthase [Balneolaceae bacterium]|nr:threonine synthase [Balneolaceae bacterium]
MIQFNSTRKKSNPVSFEDAARKGLAPDGGLYMPESIPLLDSGFLQSLPEKGIAEIGYEVARHFIETEVNEQQLKTVTNGAISFDAPLRTLKDDIYILELFHGPTLAFKDYGARFMARLVAQIDDKQEKDLVVLVATSGDTGSAVAHGFYGVEGTHVCLLYPEGKVSPVQEQQMTTLGGNITAIEVKGVFDDCQKLVKQAFSDEALNNKLRLSSANSINIARLLPQSFYYFSAYGQLQKLSGKSQSPVFSVPSGNFGNLTAGLMAMKMGLPLSRFLAATNLNDVVPEYLQTGTYRPRPSEATIANAMDVGRPSNFERIRSLFNGSHEELNNWLYGASFSDFSIMEGISRVYKTTGYLMDPHTAVGYLAVEKYRQETGSDEPAIVLSTAHPAKFGETVNKVIDKEVEVPDRLQACMNKKKLTKKMNAGYRELRDFLLMRYQK